MGPAARLLASLAGVVGVLAVVPAQGMAAEQQAYAAALNYTTPAIAAGSGDTLRFNNLDSLAQHDIDSDTPGLFDSPLVAGGQSTMVRGVDKLPPGAYAFHCSLHSWMRGSVTVAPAGGGDLPAPPQPPSPGERPDPATLAPKAPVEPLGPGDWSSYGGDLANSRSGGPDGPSYNEAPRLGPVWSFKSTDGDFTGTPAVVEGMLVAGSFGGSVYGLDAETGKKRWSRDLGEPINGSVAVDGWRVFVPVAKPNGPRVVALDLRDGKLLWSAVVDTQKDSDVYGSPVVWKGSVFIGTSAYYGEVGDSEVAVRGSVVALDAATGRRRWKTFTVPERHDGGSVWSTPAVDPGAHRLYVGTGNAYHTPAAATTDSIVALDTSSGRIVDHYQATKDDVWNATTNQLAGPDFDFGASPNLIEGADGKPLVGEGQKSGNYWALERSTMNPAWSALTGPSAPALGGIVGSTAYDHKRIYGPNTQLGMVWALDRGGRQRWVSSDGDPLHFAPISTSNGVVYGMGTEGLLTAREATTGAVLAKLPLGSGSWGGVALAGGSVFAATGMQGASGYIVAYRPRDGRGDDERPNAFTLKLTGKRRQRALRRRAVTVQASCNKRCRLKLNGLAKVSRRKRGYRLKGGLRDLSRGQRTKFKLRLSKRTRKHLRRAIRHKRRVTIRVSGKAVDIAGNVERAGLKVRVKR